LKLWHSDSLGVSSSRDEGQMSAHTY